jgi:hypothetical protein
MVENPDFVMLINSQDIEAWLDMFKEKPPYLLFILDCLSVPPPSSPLQLGIRPLRPPLQMSLTSITMYNKPSASSKTSP